MAQQRVGQDEAESSSSSISTLQSAMNQQEETLQHLRYVSKTAICMVTQSCPRSGGTDLDVGTIEFTMQIAAFDTHRRDWRALAC